MRGQLDIIDTVPGEKGYNDFRQVWRKYRCRKTMSANNDYADVAAVLQSRLQDGPRRTSFSTWPSCRTSRKRAFRFKGRKDRTATRPGISGQVAKVFSLFDEAPLSVSGDAVPVLTRSMTASRSIPGSQTAGIEFRYRAQLKQTHNVVATVPGDRRLLAALAAGCSDRQRRVGPGPQPRRCTEREGDTRRCADDQLPDCF